MTTWPRALKLMTIWLTAITIALISQGCSLERPRVASSLSRVNLASNFDHTGITTGCASCHQKDFPASGHIAINGADCSACHKPGSWLNSTANPHSPMPTQCATCHGTGAPVARYPLSHRAVAGKDCVSCHQPTVWTQVAFSHTPAPTSCNTCHMPEFKNTHRPVGTFDCVSCHQPTVWTQASFPHSPVPTSCNACHEQQRPTTAVYPDIGRQSGHFNQKDCQACHKVASVFSFAHKNANNGSVAFCLPCHETKGRQKHSTSSYFTGDGRCQQCHTYPGW